MHNGEREGHPVSSPFAPLTIRSISHHDDHVCAACASRTHGIALFAFIGERTPAEDTTKLRNIPTAQRCAACKGVHSHVTAPRGCGRNVCSSQSAFLACGCECS